MTVLKQMVSYISKALADHPEAVEVYETEGEVVVMLELRVAAEDMGRIIGRGGRQINAMRDLVRVLGGKMGKRTTLELIDHQTTLSPVLTSEEESIVQETM
jgi:predicted RNA-binding protein YlqC (UPF0109 family)